MIFSENNSNFSKAFATAWGCIETPKHNSKVSVKMKSGSYYNFEYTDMVGILDAVRELFKEHGIGITQNAYTELGERGNVACVETMFLHSSGEWMKSYPLKFPAADSMQDFGGQITYMKRYSLSALLGLSTDKDDDSNGYSGNSYEHQKKQQNNNRQTTQKSQNTPALMSDAQRKMIGSKITDIANKSGMSQQMVADTAKVKLGFEVDKQTKTFTSQEASKYISLLIDMEKVYEG